MTANDTTRGTSDNSVSHTNENTEIITEHDTRHRRIVKETRIVRGTTTRRDLLAKIDGLDSAELNTRLGNLKDGGYVNLVGGEDHELILLTCRGEHCAGGHQ